MGDIDDSSSRQLMKKPSEQIKAIVPKGPMSPTKEPASNEKRRSSSKDAPSEFHSPSKKNSMNRQSLIVPPSATPLVPPMPEVSTKKQKGNGSNNSAKGGNEVKEPE